jgi:hypothetical protein
LIFFHGFRRTAGLADIWPVPLLDLICFVAHLYTLNLSHSTVSCYISGMTLIKFHCTRCKGTHKKLIYFSSEIILKNSDGISAGA